MKRSILALITAFVMLMGLVGCSSEGMTLLSEMRKVSTWEAYDESGTVRCTVEAMGVKANLVAEYEAYSRATDLKQKTSMQFKEFKVIDHDAAEINLKVSPVKVYMDGMKFYISTSYITELCGFMGLDASSFMDTTKEYVALDMTDMVVASGIDFTNMDALIAQSYSMYENSKVEIPITKEGNTYTVAMNADQMLDAFVTFCNESAENSLTIEQYKAMGLTEEQIKEVIASSKEVYAEMKEGLRPYIQGSTAEITYAFEENYYTMTTNLDFKITIEDEVVRMNIELTDEVRNSTAKEVEFPTNVKVYSMTEIMEELMSNMQTVIKVSSKDILVENGVTYVPFRAAMEQVGVGIQFDNTTKKTSILVGNNAMEVETILKGNRAYVSLETLAGLGVNIQVIE